MSLQSCDHICPDSKVHGANMGPTWGRQDPGGPHVGHVKLAIWVVSHIRVLWLGFQMNFFLSIIGSLNYVFFQKMLGYIRPNCKPYFYKKSDKCVLMNLDIFFWHLFTYAHIPNVYFLIIPLCFTYHDTLRRQGVTEQITWKSNLNNRLLIFNGGFGY